MGWFSHLKALSDFLLDNYSTSLGRPQARAGSLGEICAGGGGLSPSTPPSTRRRPQRSKASFRSTSNRRRQARAPSTKNTKRVSHPPSPSPIAYFPLSPPPSPHPEIAHPPRAYTQRRRRAPTIRNYQARETGERCATTTRVGVGGDGPSLPSRSMGRS